MKYKYQPVNRKRSTANGLTGKGFTWVKLFACLVITAVGYAIFYASPQGWINFSDSEDALSRFEESW